MKILFPLVAPVFILLSCLKENNIPQEPYNPTIGHIKVKKDGVKYEWDIPYDYPPSTTPGGGITKYLDSGFTNGRGYILRGIYFTSSPAYGFGFKLKISSGDTLHTGTYNTSETTFDLSHYYESLVDAWLVEPQDYISVKITKLEKGYATGTFEAVLTDRWWHTDFILSEGEFKDLKVW